MPSNGIIDRGVRGLQFDRPVVLGDGSYLDPCAAGPHLFEDFVGPLGATLADSTRVSIAQSGTAITAAAASATAGAPTAGHGGWIAGATDDVDNEIDEIALGDAGWLVPAGLGTGGMVVMEAGLVLPAVTARLAFVGLGDAITGGADDDGMLSIVTGTTLVSGATGDAAGFVFSSLATNGDQWYTGAVKATTVGTAYDTSDGTAGAAMDAATADDYTKLRVEIDANGNVWFYSAISTTKGREQKVVYRQYQPSAITTTAVLVPILQFATTTTTSVVWEIDYIFGAASTG